MDLELCWGAQRPCSLEEFARRCTLHGIQHVLRHRRYTARNLLWLLAFLGSLGLLLHVYAKCVGLYFQYPHSTQLEEETARNKTFPAVTFCNLNPARFSRLSGHDLYWAGELLGLLDGAGRPLAPEGTERSTLAALRGKLDLSEEEQSRPFHLEEFYGRVGHQLELGEMLVCCTFGGKECTSSDFQTVSGGGGLRGQGGVGTGHPGWWWAGFGDGDGRQGVGFAGTALVCGLVGLCRAGLGMLGQGWELRGEAGLGSTAPGWLPQVRPQQGWDRMGPLHPVLPPLGCLRPPCRAPRAGSCSAAWRGGP
uniref:Acid-sensing ion channel 1 n=1 Tax=Anas zonorhyncha TaxID=75864 RepID=A0A8B9TYG1_9AVES